MMTRDDKDRSETRPDRLDDEQTDGEKPDDPSIDDQVDGTDQEHLRMLFGEKLVPEILRRGIESGMGTFMRSDRGVRKVISDLKLHRELTNYFFHQIDETKNAALRVVAHEVRGFLENTNLEQSLYTVLTSVAFEIKTEVRFVPSENGPLRPRVESKVQKPSKKKAKAKKKVKKAKAKKKKAPKKPESDG